MRKYSKDTAQKIKEILFYDWDPIGVSEDKNLENEYEAYVWPIYRILETSRDSAEIENFLKLVEERELECPTKSSYKTVTDKLLKISFSE